jgi:hypothetical protein
MNTNPHETLPTNMPQITNKALAPNPPDKKVAAPEIDCRILEPGWDTPPTPIVSKFLVQIQINTDCNCNTCRAFIAAAFLEELREGIQIALTKDPIVAGKYSVTIKEEH